MLSGCSFFALSATDGRKHTIGLGYLYKPKSVVSAKLRTLKFKKNSVFVYNKQILYICRLKAEYDLVSRKIKVKGRKPSMFFIKSKVKSRRSKAEYVFYKVESQKSKVESRVCFS